MTMRNLLTFFEGYYGEKYTGIFLDVMTGYLEEHREDFYKAAAAVIPKRYSRSFNKVPGIAEFEANMTEILGKMPNRPRLPEPEPELTEEEIKKNKEIIDRINKKLAGRSV